MVGLIFHLVETELTDLQKNKKNKLPDPHGSDSPEYTTAVGILHGVAPLFLKNPVVSFP